jgi:hypothetical protein
MGASFTIAAGPHQRILRSESRGTRDQIFLSQIPDSPTWRTMSPYFLHEQSDPVIPPGIGFHFSSPRTTRRATVEILDRACTRAVPLIFRESGSELFYDWRFTANQFVLATNPSRLTTSNFIFQLNTCGYGPYVTSSLRRGWVCRLQLLLILASALILRSESRGTHDHILLSQIRDSLNLEGQIPVFISPRNKVTRLYPTEFIPLRTGSMLVACLWSGYIAFARTIQKPSLSTGFLLLRSYPLPRIRIYRAVTKQWLSSPVIIS